MKVHHVDFEEVSGSCRTAPSVQGASLVEYALLIATLSLVLLVSYRAFTDQVSTSFSETGSYLTLPG